MKIWLPADIFHISMFFLYPEESKEKERKLQMRLLVTAFEPFGQDRDNASLEVMKRLSAPEGCELIKKMIPVVFGKAAEVVNELIDREKPDVVICLGQAGGRSSISVERKAVNLCRTERPDNEGNCPEDRPVIPGGADVLEPTLPVDYMCKCLADADIPVELSDSAGTYVCNSLMYGMLHHLEETGQKIQAGFIHVPYFREQVSEKQEGIPFMERDEMVKGIQLCLECLVKRNAKQ